MNFANRAGVGLVLVTSLMTSFVAAEAAVATTKKVPTLDIIGEGSARAAAEFMKLSIKVAAQCHSSAREARLALGQQLDQVGTMLSQHLERGVEQQLQVLPGVAQKSNLEIYQDGSRIQVCEESWHSAGTIVFKLTQIGQLELLQDEILSLDPSSSPERNHPRVSVKLEQPQPGVFAATYDGLTDAALEKALAQAERQARLLVRQTGGSDIQLMNVAPASASGGVIYDRTDLGGDAEASSQFSILVQVARSFSFQVKK